MKVTVEERRNDQMVDVQLLRVFVASPGDVQPEREALANAINNVNTTLAGLEPIQLQLIRWENDVEPAVGADPQAIVNAQIGTDYQIFVGILWKHFGTPTPRADSGTHEEFQRAVERHSRNPASVSVMFYFKTAPIHIDVDTDQLARVQKFRKEYYNTGLYGTFTDTKDFAEKIQMRLMRTAIKWSREGKAPEIVAVAESPPSLEEDEPEASYNSGGDNETQNQKEDEDDLGFLDSIEEGTSAFQEVVEISYRMKRHVDRLGSDIRKHTVDLKNAHDETGAVDIVKAKRAINAAALCMDQFAHELEGVVEPFRDAYGRAIRSYNKAAILLGDFGGDVTDQLKGSIETTIALENAIGKSQSSMREFRDVISKQPRMTSKFNRARKRVLEVLDLLDVEMSSAKTSTRETTEVFEELMRSSRMDEAG